MYVRNKRGEIFDCYEREQMHKQIYYPKKSKTNGYIDYEDVYKKSDNIIDILEEGDYVNGNKVLEKEGYLLWVFDNYKYDTLYFNEEDIKSIVTKELFESMEYKL